MSLHNSQRILVISQNDALSEGLKSALREEWACRLECFSTRLEGFRHFRTHRQPIVIFDETEVGIYPARMFRMIRKLRRHTVTMVATSRSDGISHLAENGVESDEVLDMAQGPENVLRVLRQALSDDRKRRESLFVKHVVFFGALMFPIWMAVAWLMGQNRG